MSESFQRIYLSDELSSVAIEQKQAIDFYLNETLFPDEQEHFTSRINELRKVEFLGVRRLRTKLNLQSAIKYLESGKPFLCDQLDTFISISHSKNYCALGTSLKEIGIDIEEINPRIDRIASRFLHDNERRFIGEQTLLDLTKLWTMKEAMFKLNKRSGIEFKSELVIEEKSGDIYYGKMLTELSWEQVTIDCFQVGELVVSACRYS
jgi:phosphopantetheinyl transferase